MEPKQDWRTESYKGMDVHVCALSPTEVRFSWDFTVRVTQPGDDSASESELTAESGDDAHYPSKEAAVRAGLVKGYALVDGLLQ